MDDGEEEMIGGMSEAHKAIAYFVQPILLFVGIVGNIMSIYVLNRRSLRSSTATYLLAIAVVSLIYVLFYIPFLVKEFVEDGSDAYVLGMVSYQCYIGVYIIDSMGTAAIWITTVVAMERCVQLLLPERVESFCRRKVAALVSGVIVIACLLKTIPRIFECRPVFHHNNTTNETEDVRMIKLPGYDKTAAVFADTIISSIIPFVIIIISNIVLVYNLIKSQRRNNELNISQTSNDKTELNIQTRKMEGVTILVLANTVLFTLSQALGTVLHINVFIRGMVYYQMLMSESIGFYSNVCSLVYYCFTSVVYLMISSIYRRKLKKLFSSILKRSSDSHSSEIKDIIDNSYMETELKSMVGQNADS